MPFGWQVFVKIRGSPQEVVFLKTMPQRVHCVETDGPAQVALAADPAHLEASLPVRSLVRLAMSALVFGLSRAGPVFLLSATDAAHSALSLLLHSFARFGPPSVLPGWAHTGVSLSVRSLVCAGPSPAMLGLSRTESVSLPPAASSVQLELPPFPQSSAHLGPSPLALAFSHPSVAMLLQSATRCGSVPFALGGVRIGALPPVLDLAGPELALPLQGRMAPGPLLFAFGLARTDLVSSPSVTDFVHLDALPPARSSVRPGVAISALDFAQFGSLPLARAVACLGFLPLAMGVACVGLVSLLLVVDLAHSGLLLPIRSSACPELALLAPDPVNPGSPLLTRSFCRLGSNSSTLGVLRFGAVSSLPVLGVAHPASPPFVRASARTEPAAPALGLATSGPPLPARGAMWPNSSLAPCGAKLGFLAPALDCASLEPLLSLRSCSRTGTLLFALGFAHLDLPLLIRGCSCIDSAMSISGLCSIGLFLSVPSFASFELSLFLQGPGCFGLPPSTTAFSHPGPFLPTRALCRADLLLSASGPTCLGSVSSLPAVDYSRLGPASPLRCCARLGAAPFVLSYARLGPALTLRCRARSGLAIFLCGPAQLDLLPVVLDHTSLGVLSMLHSSMHMGLAAPVLDFGVLGAVLLARSFSQAAALVSVLGVACCGPPLVVPDFAASGAAASSRSHAHFASPLSTCGLVRCGFLLSTLGACSIDPFSSARSLARLDLLVLAPDFASPGLPSPLRRCAAPGPPLSAGAARLGFSPPALSSAVSGAAMLARDMTRPELSSAALGSARPDATASTLDMAQPGLSLPLRSFVQVELGPLVLGLGCLDFCTSACGPCNVGTSLPLRSFSHFDFFLALVNFMHLAVLLPTRAMTCIELPVPAPGLSRAGSVFCLPVTDAAFMASPLPSKSSSHLSSPALALGFASLGFALVLQHLAQADLPLPVFGCCRLGSTSSTAGALAVGFSLPPRSFLCLGPSTPAPSFAHFGFLPPVRAAAQPGPASPVLGGARLGFVSSSSVPGASHSDAPLTARSSARPEASALALDFAAFGLSLLLQQSARPGPFLTVLGKATLGPSLSVVQACVLGPLLLLHSLAYTDSATFAPGLSHSGVLLPLHSSSQTGVPTSIPSTAHLDLLLFLHSSLSPGFPLFACALSRLGFLSPPSVADVASLGPPPPPRSPARLDASPPATGLGAFGAAPPLRSRARLGPVPPALGAAASGAPAKERRPVLTLACGVLGHVRKSGRPKKGWFSCTGCSRKAFIKGLKRGTGKQRTPLGFAFETNPVFVWPVFAWMFPLDTTKSTKSCVRWNHYQDLSVCLVDDHLVSP